jgi:hypothetical protein
MRALNSHLADPENPAGQTRIVVLDEPGEAGACHEYSLIIGEHRDGVLPKTVLLRFQKGPVRETGQNGVATEDLIAIALDRIGGFISGPFDCGENHRCAFYLRQALKALHARTRDRIIRKVEGRSVP